MRFDLLDNGVAFWLFSGMEAHVRKIIHIDMDAFFASVEQRDNPELAGKPIAVGGSGKRGVVAAASYEARKYGVYSAMSSRIAIQKCPELIFVKPRFDVYKTVSLIIRSIFKDYTDLVEPLSLDEAYLDVTSNKKGMPSATLIAREIKHRIKDQTKLTASAGVSVNKFLAKIASDYHKPDGLFVIPPGNVTAFIEALPIEKFFGVGKVTATRMKKLGIYTGADLRRMEKEQLKKLFGKAGGYFYEVSRGIDSRPVVSYRPRKSLGAETTFEEDYQNPDELIEQLNHLAKLVHDRAEKSGNFGITLTVKIKFSDFTQITRSTTIDNYIRGDESISKLAEELFRKAFIPGMKIRLLGITISNFKTKPKQQTTQYTLNF